MRLDQGILWVVSLLSMVYMTPAAAGVVGKLELWFEYNGRQSNFDTIPTVKCFHRENLADAKCDLYQSNDDRYWIDRPVPGDYILRIHVGAQDAVLYREYPFTVSASTTGPLLIAVNRPIRLDQPVQINEMTYTRALTCKEYDGYTVPVLALLPNAELNFAWQRLLDADSYHYKLWRVRCGDDQHIEPLLLGSTRQDKIQLQVPANEKGEYYALELSARNGAQEIGQLLLNDITAGVHNTYPFVVSDPLGERIWYPYVMAVFSVLILAWLGLWLLRGVAIFRPGRGFVMGVAIVFVLGMGFLYRHNLLTWGEEGKEWVRSVLSSQKWYRSTDKDDGYTVAREFTGGDWQGYLVASGEEPFVGNRRRAEIRVRFSGETAQVSFLLNGRWQAIPGVDFATRRSAAGMTLIGHARKGQKSELWSISIADLQEPVLLLNLDRMISRRSGRDGEVISERYQATGELRHTLQ